MAGPNPITTILPFICDPVMVDKMRIINEYAHAVVRDGKSTPLDWYKWMQLIDATSHFIVGEANNKEAKKVVQLRGKELG